MGIEVIWDDDMGDVLRWAHTEPWDMEDFTDAIRETHRIIEDTGHSVHIIFDEPGQTFPRGIWTQAKRLMEPLPDDTRFVMVTRSTLISTAANTFTQLFKDIGKRFKVVKTLDDARAWLRNGEQSFKRP